MPPFRDVFQIEAEKRAAAAAAADIRVLVKTVEDAKGLAELYWLLVKRALDVVSDVPFRADFGLDDESASLTFEGDKAILTWSECESDYYGGGHIDRNRHRFPASALLISDADLEGLRSRLKAEEAERAAKLRAAQEAVERDRREARDRAEWFRLKAKFGEKA